MNDLFDVHQSVINIIRQLQGMALSPHEADRIKSMVDARTRRIA